MHLPETSYQLTMTDAVLAMLLAYRIHGTDAAIKATAHRVRDKVRIACRPTINNVIRCRSQTEWARHLCEDETPWP
jgi:alcohol dehydrogenase YqhD (iron-dependent ADH family)